MELSREGAEVEDKNCNNARDITKKCTKSCQEAYDIYIKNGGKPCPYYHGDYFLGMLTKALNLDFELSQKTCIELIKLFKIWKCDLYKEETDWK